MDLIKTFGEELAGKIKETIGDKSIILNDGSYIPRERLNEEKQKLEGERDSYKSQFETLSKKMKDLESLTGENTTLKEKIQQIEKETEKIKSESESKFSALKKKHLIEAQLLKDKARNSKSVLALLDMEKIQVDGEKLLGYSDQIEGIKKDNDFLFGEETPDPNTPPKGKSPNPKSKEGEPKTTRAQYEDLIENTGKK